MSVTGGCKGSDKGHTTLLYHHLWSDCVRSIPLLCYLTMDQIIAKKILDMETHKHVACFLCAESSALQQRWLRDEWERKEQRRQQKRAVKFPHSVTLNITSSPVLQYSLIISKHPFICQQPCIKKRSYYGCLVIYIAGVYAYVDAGMAKMKKQT